MFIRSSHIWRGDEPLWLKLYVRGQTCPSDAFAEGQSSATPRDITAFVQYGVSSGPSVSVRKTDFSCSSAGSSNHARPCKDAKRQDCSSALLKSNFLCHFIQGCAFGLLQLKWSGSERRLLLRLAESSIPTRNSGLCFE